MKAITSCWRIVDEAHGNYLDLIGEHGIDGAQGRMKGDLPYMTEKDLEEAAQIACELSREERERASRQQEAPPATPDQGTPNSDDDDDDDSNNSDRAKYVPNTGKAEDTGNKEGPNKNVSEGARCNQASDKSCTGQGGRRRGPYKKRGEDMKSRRIGNVVGHLHKRGQLKFKAVLDGHQAAGPIWIEAETAMKSSPDTIRSYIKQRNAKSRSAIFSACGKLLKLFKQ